MLVMFEDAQFSGTFKPYTICKYRYIHTHCFELFHIDSYYIVLYCMDLQILYIYMYVCMYVRTYVCMYVCMYMCAIILCFGIFQCWISSLLLYIIEIYCISHSLIIKYTLHMSIHIYIYVHVYIYIQYVYTQTYICIIQPMDIYIYIGAWICVYVHILVISTFPRLRWTGRSWAFIGLWRPLAVQEKPWQVESFWWDSNGWLVVWNMFIFHNIWDNPSYWLIYFKMVKTTNQMGF